MRSCGVYGIQKKFNFFLDKRGGLGIMVDAMTNTEIEKSRTEIQTALAVLHTAQNDTAFDSPDHRTLGVSIIILRNRLARLDNLESVLRLAR